MGNTASSGAKRTFARRLEHRHFGALSQLLLGELALSPHAQQLVVDLVQLVTKAVPNITVGVICSINLRVHGSHMPLPNRSRLDEHTKRDTGWPRMQFDLHYSAVQNVDSGCS